MCARRTCSLQGHLGRLKAMLGGSFKQQALFNGKSLTNSNSDIGRLLWPFIAWGVLMVCMYGISYQVGANKWGGARAVVPGGGGGGGASVWSAHRASLGACGDGRMVRPPQHLGAAWLNINAHSSQRLLLRLS